MKNVILSTLLLASNYAFADTSCVLADVALSKSPVVSITIDESKNCKFYFYKNSDLGAQIWGKLSAKDESEDLVSIYTNKEKDFSIRWSTDVTDKTVMGMTEGTIKSTFMTGKILCTQVED